MGFVVTTQKSKVLSKYIFMLNILLLSLRSMLQILLYISKLQNIIETQNFIYRVISYETFNYWGTDVEINSPFLFISMPNRRLYAYVITMFIYFLEE